MLIFRPNLTAAVGVQSVKEFIVDPVDISAEPTDISARKFAVNYDYLCQRKACESAIC
jgi:hypothetical protein